MIASLSKHTQKNMLFIWSEACQKAFDHAKHALTRAPVLVLLDFTISFGQVCGACIWKEVLGTLLM